MSLSVVITTYNRANLVPRSVRSALDALARTREHEVIVVDDASTDGTVEHLRTVFSAEVAAARVRVLQNSTNRGVTGSKNEGYLVAKHAWVVFLDSDDTLLPDAGDAMAAVLRANGDKPIVFFRCTDEYGNFVGRRFIRDVCLDLNMYLKHTSYGEALTAINKRCVSHPPYVESLRGYEGLGCCRIIARHGSALLSTVIARRYDRGGVDRLSAPRGFLLRMPLVARGHLMLVYEFWRQMPAPKAIGCLVKAAVYGLIGLAYRLATNKLV